MKELNKPRIVVFSLAYAPMVGGAEIALSEYIERLPQYEFTVITRASYRQAPCHEHIGCARVYRVGHSVAWLGRFANYIYIPFAVRVAWRLHRRQPFDMVWSMMAAYGGGAAYLFMRLYPAVPVVLTLQEGDPLEHIERLVRWMKGFYRDFFARVAYVQTISTYLAYIARHFGAIAPITVVPNGVDVGLFSARSENDPYQKLGISDDAIVVFSASRLEVKNGVDTLVEALAHETHLVVIIAGLGSMHDALVARARTLGVFERLFLLGVVPYRDLPAYYQAADVFARPARSEGMGNAFIEAMAAGVPVVGTTVGGIADFAKAERNMLVVPPEDPHALAVACARINADSVLRSQLVAGGKETATLYDWNDLAKRMSTIFDTVLAHGTDA